MTITKRFYPFNQFCSSQRSKVVWSSRCNAISSSQNHAFTFWWCALLQWSELFSESNIFGMFLSFWLFLAFLSTFWPYSTLLKIVNQRDGDGWPVPRNSMPYWQFGFVSIIGWIIFWIWYFWQFFVILAVFGISFNFLAIFNPIENS